MLRHVARVSAFSSFVLIAAPAFAADDEWKFIVSPYFWAAYMDGKVGSSGHVAEVDASFSDLWDQLEFGALGQFEAHKGKLGLVLSPIYEKLEGEGSGPRGFVDADVESASVIVEGFATWALIPEFELFVGGRYTQVDTDVHLSVAGGRDVSSSDTENWIDPFVGMRWILPLDDKWRASFRGDVGGFGVESDLVWNITALIGYRINPSIALYGGYRVLDYDYENDGFTWDVQMGGPMLGFAWTL
jgi:hypothetical protein